MLFKKGHISWNKGIKTSEIGYLVSEKTKKKISEACKGRSPWNKGKKGIYSKETLEKMSEAKIGQFVSNETKRKMSEATTGEKNPFYGKHHTKEVKEKSRKINIGNSHALGCHWTEVAKKKKSEAEMGEGGPFYGRHHTEEARLKISKAHLGKKASPEVRLNISKGGIGKHCGEKNPMWGRKGKKHPRWKGGNLLSTKIRGCFEYRQWRSDVFTRDDFTCQKCNKRGGYLHAHHINPFADIILLNDIKTLEQASYCRELWNINNGITLCPICHYSTKIKDSEEIIK